MKTTMEKTHDQHLQDAVENALRWAPEVEAAKIGVGVRDGVVTLSGQVPSYWQKLMAGKAALRTRGVTALANEILVHHITDPRTDSDIAFAAHNVLKWSSEIPKDSITAAVENHVVTLTGELGWNFQRETAMRLIEHLAGVTDVVNRMTLKPRAQASASGTETRIHEALVRNAAIDASHVHVTVDGTRVLLTGAVSSYAERRQAELAAWSSPHVDEVDNRILVQLR
ncbi:BON domain-containing protein [Aeromicrobium sp. 9AM]|uniref:BON domain-containing protein n=1 Tax=Aeromicrobium sp. 9AM TaxID=2653126 RepID=UPI0012F0D4FC|nr:BON domain-containing protein [Aeromicrobium sp. 9AM]VXC12285.1 conserved hypothetical protein [Aeromicrobium sp. 9AM]